MSKSILITVVVALVSGIVGAWVFQRGYSLPSAISQKESVYERVMRTKTLRCAYANHPPFTIVDPNTKNITGIYHDIVEDIGNRLGVKIEWAEEVGYGNINVGFEAGRYDIFCSNLWPTLARAKKILFTLPLFYTPAFVWVRADDTRFDDDAAKLNDPQFTISMTEGDGVQPIADRDFPLARRLAATQSSDLAQKVQDVVAKKADATLTDVSTAMGFLANNPGSLKIAGPGKPLRVFPNVIGLPLGEHQFKFLLDAALGELLAEGAVEKIVKKYTGDKTPFYFAGEPFKITP